MQHRIKGPLTACLALRLFCNLCANSQWVECRTSNTSTVFTICVISGLVANNTCVLHWHAGASDAMPVYHEPISAPMNPVHILPMHSFIEPL